VRRICSASPPLRPSWALLSVVRNQL